MRTKEEILKDFENLGYDCREDIFSGQEYIYFYKTFHNYYYDGDLEKCIIILIDTQEYLCHNIIDNSKDCPITMQEHKLLNELFLAMGWI